MDFFVELKFAVASDPFLDPEDPLHPRANDFRFESAQTMLDSFVANWPPMLLKWGISFALIFSVYLYTEGMRALFAGIVMVQPLPNPSTISKSPLSRWLLLALRTS